MVKLSVLDYAQIDELKDAQTAVKESTDLAKVAEKLGFHRYWVAEHHNVPAFASSSPEMLMMHIADSTKRIRIGSGGVMIPHYSPYKVAENFRMLEAFHPNRIDLGIGNSLGTNLVNKALNETKERKLPYNQSIQDLYKYVTDTNDAEHRLNDITANPKVDTVPQMFQLTTSTRGAKNAAKNGFGLTLGLFPNASSDKLNVGKEAAEIYRSEFKASKAVERPIVMFSPFVVVADTDAEAKELQKALDVWLLGKNHFDEFKQFPSVETAKNYQFTQEDLKIVQANRSRMVVGDIDSVKVQLDHLVNQFQADEILIIPLMPKIENRIKALELLANRFSIK